MKENLIETWRLRDGKSKKETIRNLRQLGLKKNKDLAEQADRVHQEVFEKIDCLDCANCCTSIPPMLVKSDIKRIAKHLGLKEKTFADQYLRMDEDGDMVMNTSPCVFLGEGNKCDIYEVRPKACRQYPHTDGYEFGKNLHLHSQNIQYCPAVFHIIQRLSGAKI